jgi:D-beta-D-heptose 7-phosphate kinase/D-beta-D-heptose 1-phosphate adenosyltransferase
MFKRIFCNGAFDCLHPGHIDILMQCRFLAGRDGEVIIGLDFDEKVKKDKGSNRPVFSFCERLDMLLSLKSLDNFNIIDVIKGFNTNKELYTLIKKYSPDIIVKDSCWARNVIGSDLADVYLYKPKIDISTTKIIDRILEKYGKTK